MEESDMTEKEIYENKINLISNSLKNDVKLLKSGLVFFVAGLLIAILGAVVESLIWLFSLIFFAIFALCIAFFVALISRDTKVLNMLNSLESYETETKEIHCYKYNYISAADNQTSVVYGICVHTDMGKYYYLLNEGFSIKPGAVLPGVQAGVHEIEVYKGTNIITAFNAIDKEIEKYNN